MNKATSTRLAKAEARITPPLQYCVCPRKIDYRDGITEAGGERAPLVCPVCGLPTGDIPVTLQEWGDHDDNTTQETA